MTIQPRSINVHSSAGNKAKKCCQPGSGKFQTQIRILKQLKRYIDGVVSSQLRPKSTERRRFLSYYSRTSWRIAFCFYIISAATEDFRGYPPLSILGQALAETSIGLSDGFVS